MLIDFGKGYGGIIWIISPKTDNLVDSFAIEWIKSVDNLITDSSDTRCLIEFISTGILPPFNNINIKFNKITTNKRTLPLLLRFRSNAIINNE